MRVPGIALLMNGGTHGNPLGLRILIEHYPGINTVSRRKEIEDGVAERKGNMEEEERQNGDVESGRRGRVEGKMYKRGMNNMY
jgi:hypothetical protein